MRVIIAEKPSVAREIAALVGAWEKREGYFSGEDYCVTWALGHLITLSMPEDYGVKGFIRESLPIVPDPFQLTVRKKDKGPDADSGAMKQLNVIENLFEKCTGIIAATDAGREGELIFRYIYHYLKCSKPFERLWISSLTEKAIKSGLESLKPGKDFDGLFEAARSRSQADWLVGINASQALSIASGSGVYSLGRVQTPTLALICKRFLDHQNFSVHKYYQVRLQHRKDFINFTSLSQDKWDDKKLAESLLRSVQKAGAGTVTKAEVKPVSERPPLLFDLTGLQKQCNEKLNLSADETLTIAQKLYEMKFITYPRTGSCYIPEDVWEEVPNLIRAMNDRESLKVPSSKVRWGQFTKRIVNDLKVTDHHGLLITEKMPSALSEKESAVYDMIALRLLEAISPSCQKEIMSIEIEVNNYQFLYKGTLIKNAGWRIIREIFSEDNEETLEHLIDLKVGDEVKIKDGEVLEKQTKPLPLYTESGLLSAMENCGKDIEDQQERSAIKDIGIGTPATRAAIIETLFKRDYIKREKKNLVPTEKGLKVYELLKDKKIADVAMTGQWELALQGIEEGKVDYKKFQKEIIDYATGITNEILSSDFHDPQMPKLLCPKCKTAHLLIREKIVKCRDGNCKWLQFRSVCGIQLSMADIEGLVTSGKTSLIKGFKSKAGKKFDACIVLDETSKSSFEIVQPKKRK